MDRLQAMQVFVRVVETGGFTRAASSLQMPRATVSMAVQELEAHLGVRLLHRTTRKVSLTQDGAAYYERCQNVLEDLDEVESLFRQTDLLPKGKLKVDVPGRIARLVIAPALPDFFRRFPDIELELGATDRPVDLVQEGVDCVLRGGELGDSRLVAKPLGALEMSNYAGAEYLRQHGTPLSLSDLERHAVVKYVSPLTGKAYDWEYIADGEFHTVPVRGMVSTNNVDTYIACALAGLGLIQMPTYDAQDYVGEGRLVEILPEWRAPPVPIAVLYPHRRHRSGKVRAFIEWIEGLLRERSVIAPTQ